MKFFCLGVLFSSLLFCLAYNLLTRVHRVQHISTVDAPVFSLIKFINKDMQEGKIDSGKAKLNKLSEKLEAYQHGEGEGLSPERFYHEVLTFE